jgi:predicted ATP-grasp superfamily ATP-dependent carboligase
VHDAAGTPFLLLAGPEPDVQWERFVAAVRMLVDELGVRMTVGLNAIPMALPHTRPISVIGHGSRPELVGVSQGWVDTVQVPATAGHLLEYRLAQAGYDSAGFAVAVPHYLAETEFPSAAAVLLDNVAQISGLQLPLDELQERAAEIRGRIDEQVAASDEVAAVVRALEEQYDSFLAGRERSLLADEGDELPTADELGAEFEQFLAQQTPPGEGPSAL